MARICAGQGLRSIALLLATTLGIFSLGSASGAEAARPKPSRAKAKIKSPDSTVDIFDGMKSGDLEVKLIATDATKGNVMISNKTKQTISVRLPKAFAGVPVLAQFRGLNVPNNALNAGNNFAPNGGARGANGANGVNQALGGGIGQAASGLNGNGNGNGVNNGGIMNIPPEKTTKFRVPLVCLEHGKADPRATIPYEIKPIDSLTKDVAVQQLCTMLGEGKVEQRVAQVAAWHLANGLSYDELAAKQLEEFGSPARPCFTSQEMQDAVTVVDKAQARAVQAAKAANENGQRTTASPVEDQKQADRQQAGNDPRSGDVEVGAVSTGAGLQQATARRKSREK